MLDNSNIVNTAGVDQRIAKTLVDDRESLQRPSKQKPGQHRICPEIITGVQEDKPPDPNTYTQPTNQVIMRDQILLEEDSMHHLDKTAGETKIK